MMEKGKRMSGLFVALAAGVLLTGTAGAAAPGAFRAGAAKGNITPALGCEIVGGFNPFPSKHIHDDLWVRCLVLDDGTTRVAFAVCDLVGMTRHTSDQARQWIQEETGLPAGNILVSGVHTHSATISLGDDRYLIELEMNDYQRMVARRIADTVRCAINNLAPARIGWATASEPRHVFNRRWYMKPGTVPVNPCGGSNDVVKMNPARCDPNLVKPAGPTDPEICLFAVQTPEGRPLALFANYSLHYVGGVRGADISADYYGMFNDRIQELLGADRQDPPFISIMSNGTSGDVNNIDFTKPAEQLPPYAKMRIVANDVAQKAFAAYQAIPWRDHVTLGVSYEEIDLRFRRPTPQELARAEGVIRAKAASGMKGDTVESYFAERHVRMARLPESVKIPLQALRIGEVGIATVPVEPFCEMGLDIKRRSPFKPTFVVSLAHGYFGYLPTPAQHALGGYEAWLGSSRLEIDAMPEMTDALLRMLTQLKPVGAGPEPAK